MVDGDDDGPEARSPALGAAEPAAHRAPPVLLLAAGGTISTVTSREGTVYGLDGAAVLASAGDLGEVDVAVRDVAEGPSWAYAPEAVERLARAAVAGASSGEHRGVVLTHGTDTLEETLFLTWLLGGAAASERCPIVFTGAMHRSDHPEPDGPANLREAIALAAGGGTPGPVLRIGGRTHHARWARKLDTSALDTFASVGARAVGHPPPHGDRIDGRVAEIHSATGMDPAAIDHALDAGARGLVLVGTGAGNVHGALRAGLERALADEVPVVVTSRCTSGPVAAEYGGDLGGWTLADLGCVLAGDLPTGKARVALWVALAVDPSPAGVRAWFSHLLAEPG
jgi:L-asparaginase